jgi:hypothetical protein
VHECGPSAPGVVNPDDVRSPTPGDPAIYGGTVADQYDLAEVHAPQAWAITHGNPDILVAVLDTGVDAEQQDLRADV